MMFPIRPVALCASEPHLSQVARRGMRRHDRVGCVRDRAGRAPDDVESGPPDILLPARYPKTGRKRDDTSPGRTAGASAVSNGESRVLSGKSHGEGRDGIGHQDPGSDIHGHIRHPKLRLHDLRHAVLAGCGRQASVADASKLYGQRRPAALHFRASRGTEVARRRECDVDRLRHFARPLDEQGRQRKSLEAHDSGDGGRG